jgi:hypothetical protein
MAKNIRQTGLSLFECVVSLFLLQVLIFSSWPTFQTFFRDKITHSILMDLKESIEWSRWQAAIRNEIIFLEMHENGWQIYSSKTLLRDEKSYLGFHEKIFWHGFSNGTRFIFYPDIYQNHLNGYFQMGSYRLWVNRLGHMRESYGL